MTGPRSGRSRTARHLTVAFLVMVLCVAYFLWREQTTVGGFGFPLDDSWIHAQFARNVASGDGFSFNPGVPEPGSTAPLWTLVSAVGYKVTGNSVLAGKLIGVFFLAFSVYLTYALVRTIADDAREALFAAVVVASVPRLIWASLSGMEVTLAVTLSLGGILAHVLWGSIDDRRQYVSTVLLGLATLARPECAVFFVATSVDRVLRGTFIRWRDLAAREWLVPAAVHVVLFVAVLAPFMLFSKRFGIGFLPNTAYAKALLWRSGLIAAAALGDAKELVRSFTVRPFDYYVSFLREGLNNNPLLFMFAGVGFLRMVFHEPYAEGTRHRTFVIPLAVILFPLAMGIFVPFGDASYQEGRYAAPVAPLLLILGTVGIYGAARYAVRIFADAKSLGEPARVVMVRSLLWLFMFLALSAQARNIWYGGRLYGREVANIEEMQVTLGKWIGANLPEDVVVATNDVGAIAYFSGREILDTVGLISPAVLSYMREEPLRDRAVMNFLRDERPDYAVLFPTWYPEMVKQRAIFEPLHRAVLEDNVISGGDELVVYRLRWDRLEDPEANPDEPRDPPGWRDKVVQ